LIANIERKLESEAPADLSYAGGWLDWARAGATSLDPTSGSLDEFLSTIERLDSQHCLTISMISDVYPSFLCSGNVFVIAADR